jgi:MoaA/NifB/PqqE/SkfB family radical SAM enzyme
LIKKNRVGRYLRILGNTARRYLRGLSFEHDIKHLTFEVTNLCNSKCEMCHIWANQDSSKQLTTTEIRNAFSDPAFKNLEDVIITGGEAFLRDDLVEIVDCIWSINGKTSITLSTNGILADKILNVAGQLFEKRIPIVYGISLDGVQVQHDARRRVEGNFRVIDEVLIPGLKLLATKNPELVKIGIGHCLDDYGFSTFDSVQAYCKEKGIGFMSQLIEDFDYYLPEKKQQRSKGDWKEIHLIKKGFEGNNRLLKKDIYKNQETEYASLIKKLPPSVHHYRLISILGGKPSSYECSSLRNFFLLRYDGAVTPCLRFCTKEIGNVKQASVSQILNDDARKAAVKEILKCDGCLNTWCTDWSMEENLYPFKSEALKWLTSKLVRL